GELEVVFTRISQTRGGRPRQNKWDHESWMRKHCGHGGCFINIPNPQDDLCLPRALVVAMARIEKEEDPQVASNWEAIRRPRQNGLQKKLALTLMRQAGLRDHEGPCGEQEIRKLQAALEPMYQIKIFSSRCCNFLTFQGKIPSEKVLHIYHQSDENGANGHFLVVSKPHVLFNRQHWCDRCNRGFNYKRQHKCHSKCYSCFDLVECRIEDWKRCGDCSRWFRSEDCYQKHLAANGGNGAKRARIMSICQKFR
ncbi:MAG: hypothetical protein GY696_35345, partial [Gammaproteobacteria bacterium]|nr:hypothetical protein [Gammaproteobacteria bacterium]